MKEVKDEDGERWKEMMREAAVSVIKRGVKKRVGF